MPTVSIGDNAAGMDFSGTEDTKLRSEAPTTNYASSTTETHKFASGNHGMTLVRFTGLSNISGPVTVSAAEIGLFLDSASGGTLEYTCRRVLRNWVEGEATWNIYSTGNSWTTAGALSLGNDISSTVTAVANHNGTIDEYKTWSSAQLAQDVQDMINGAVANHGWHWERTDGADDGTFHVYTGSEGTDTERPYLTFTYTASGGGSPATQTLTLLGCG